MDIYYIYHSCFAIETSDYKIIFDYYKTPRSNIGNFSLEEFLSGKKPVIVFSSHSHQDHFSNEIFNWSGNITYILSDDIKLNNQKKNIYFVKEGDSLKLENLNIKVFGSTDLGVSFLLEIEGKRIFHSGDLNWWCWNDDTEEEYKYMKELYFSKIESIKKYLELEKNKNMVIDYLFIPVDPRLEENYLMGVRAFVKKILIKNIICMHFWNNFKIINDVEKIYKDCEVKVIKFNKNLIKID